MGRPDPRRDHPPACAPDLAAAGLGPGIALERLCDHLGSDRLILFSTDYPHYQFDGDDVVPPGLPPGLLRRILVDNVLETYPRMRRNV